MKPLWPSVSLWLIFIAFFSQAQTKNSPIGRSADAGGGAIIIGISQYKEVTPLQFADRDAVAFAEFLKTQQVPEDNIKLFLNEDATRFAIVDELYNTTQALQKGDRFYFYFGGHGDLEAKIGYENSLLLLYNSPKKDYFQNNEYLQLSELKTWFEAMTKKGVEVVFIADACHSGGLIGGKEGLTKTQKALQESWAGITKILSCKSDEFSLEGKQWGGGRGIFSYHLVNGLTGLADANKDKKVTLQELNKYLSVNVLREADPNVQTPVVQGNTKQLLARTDDASLKKLQADLMRSVPIITEVNIKAKEAQMLEGMDKTLTDTYDKFKKALNEKRLNTFDNEKDYALLHYRKLAVAKLPNHLMQIIKRNLGAALMERELEIMRECREKGRGSTGKSLQVLEQIIPPAIANLDEIRQLLGSTHHIHNFLQARKLVLNSQLPLRGTQSLFANTKTVDQIRKASQENIQKNNSRTKELLLKGIQLEPNMTSNYALLATVYMNNKQLDSALYYQEKVVALLPNQGYVHFNLGTKYESMTYTTTDNKAIPHPKALECYEKAILLEPNLEAAHRRLGNLHMGLHTNADGLMDMAFAPEHRNYARAINCFEKVLEPHELAEQQLAQQGQIKLPRELNYISPGWSSAAWENFYPLVENWHKLFFLHKANKNPSKAETYLGKMTQKVSIGESALGYLLVASKMYDVFTWDEDDSSLKIAYDLQQKALKIREQDIKTALPKDKSLLMLKYKEQLKGIGETNKALKNYDEAEMYFKQAIEYPVPDAPSNLKLMGGKAFYFQDRAMTYPNPHGISSRANAEYGYFIDAYSEMFLLKLEQNKTDEAFAWLEKAFQVSVIEHGNDVSGTPWEEGIFETYKNLDQDRFKALKAKYFPPTEKK